MSDSIFEDARQGLRRGDFTRLDSLFRSEGGSPARIIDWIEQGKLSGQELAEALTCACFNGRIDVAEYLLGRGVAPSGGAGTGLNAIHWAANRGQLRAVQLLLRHRVPLETKSMYEGTALGTAVYAAVYEPRPDHKAIIEELIAAGADVKEAGYPSGNAEIDAVLRKAGAGRAE